MELQRVAGDLIANLPWKRVNEPAERIEQLAEAFIDYGRMATAECPAGVPLVDARELARRFRENRRAVERALSILEADGRAVKSDYRDCWRLRV